jgi:hypothetical protein
MKKHGVSDVFLSFVSMVWIFTFGFTDLAGPTAFRNIPSVWHGGFLADHNDGAFGMGDMDTTCFA